MSEPKRPPADTDVEDNEFATLFDELQQLEQLVDSEDERQQVRDAMRAAADSQDHEPATFGRVVWGFGRSDLAEALLGSLLFGIPMAVEGGTVDAGLHIAQHPLYLAATVVIAIGLVISILYVADFQDVRVANRILGIVPRRLVGVTGTALVVSIALLTGWGLVEWSTDPAVVYESACICAVAFVPMAIGAALGDILPGN
ncbi:DUF2391 family protein [Haloarcula argentinensis]|uniref:DUF2391 family protein n=1 Tax=Haloarcula argentinensis TaxID=43776 RepID=A0A830FJ88_HALAR|nr:DUF2391 family protein [Haloarcula argentinensis]EMA23549.1 hypothetical protein C443_07793 [Haloarcula argentinensis DSM 12282]MDS0252844.1 DUF2391 family protein [Haloarcula argentinensis]GGM29094.1 hypothetical protein GCM10009006_08220 [Haloarcula argentinensis]